MGVQSVSGMASMRLRNRACWRMVMEKRTSILRQTATMAGSVEAAVGPQGEWSGGSGVAHSAHRLAQEVGGAPSRVGPALAQPGQQHLSGARGHGQQRVIAPLAGVAVMARALLAQPVGLTEGGVQVDGQRIIARTRPSGPGPSQQLPAHPVQLAHVAPPEAPQEDPHPRSRQSDA